MRGFAPDIGVSPSLISQIETDKSHPSVSTLYAIKTTLDVTIESLFGSRKTGDGDDEIHRGGDLARVRGAVNWRILEVPPWYCRSPDSFPRRTAG